MSAPDTGARDRLDQIVSRFAERRPGFSPPSEETRAFLIASVGEALSTGMNAETGVAVARLWLGDDE